jgi:hypothetical protein
MGCAGCVNLQWVHVPLQRGLRLRLLSFCLYNDIHAAKMLEKNIN